MGLPNDDEPLRLPSGCPCSADAVDAWCESFCLHSEPMVHACRERPVVEYGHAAADRVEDVNSHRLGGGEADGERRRGGGRIGNDRGEAGCRWAGPDGARHEHVGWLEKAERLG